MPLTLDEVYEAVMELSHEDHEKLMELLNGAPAMEAATGRHPAWGPELHRRAAEIDSGAVKAIPWEEVCLEVDQLLQDGES